MLAIQDVLIFRISYSFIWLNVGHLRLHKICFFVFRDVLLQPVVDIFQCCLHGNVFFIFR